jgi:hypothetical protein
MDMDFDMKLAEILGEWYPISLSKKSDDLDCMRLNITHLSGLKCRWENFNYKTEESKSYTITLSNKFNTFFAELRDKSRVITVIDSDYKNYMAVIQCNVKRNKTKYMAIIYSRTKNLPQETLSNLIKLINSKFGREFTFYMVDHNNCMIG